MKEGSHTPVGRSTEPDVPVAAAAKKTEPRPARIFSMPKPPKRIWPGKRKAFRGFLDEEVTIPEDTQVGDVLEFDCESHRDSGCVLVGQDRKLHWPCHAEDGELVVPRAISSELEDPVGTYRLCRFENKKCRRFQYGNPEVEFESDHPRIVEVLGADLPSDVWFRAPGLAKGPLTILCAQLPNGRYLEMDFGAWPAGRAREKVLAECARPRKKRKRLGICENDGDRENI